ncbi:MAG: hypothetical protein V2I33_07540, partial [Kangiellaceae bacterium]|nr:hypothetical protein [Kangiellaceae bacterium]
MIQEFLVHSKQRLEQQQVLNRWRKIKSLESAQGSTVALEQQAINNFSSNDYLSLANHPKVAESARTAIVKYGVGSGASHLISGHFDIHDELEEALAN